MENLDVFESIFKRAVREPYRYDEPRLQSILLVTDLESGEIDAYAGKVQAFLKGLSAGETRFSALCGKDYGRWAELQAQIETHDPDLIVSYRLLQEVHETAKFSLGAYLDTMSQAVRTPILVLPDPQAELPEGALQNRDTVLVVTDHLAGEHRLVNYGARLTSNGGELTLCHLEDLDTFDHYMETIERVPEINTNSARELIPKQILSPPERYIESVAEVLRKKTTRAASRQAS